MSDETLADVNGKQLSQFSSKMDWLDENLFDDAQSCLDALAQFITQQLRQAIIQQGNATIVVSGGNTPKPLYTRLQRMDIDWSKVTVTLSDERWVPPTDSQSNQRMIQETLLVGLAGRAAFVPLLTSHETPKAAEAVLGQRLSILSKPYNLTILGMGTDGHFASLFPDSPEIESGLTTEHPCVGVHPKKSKTPRMSLSLKEILKSQRIVLLVTGQEKWDVLQQALNSLETPPEDALVANKTLPIRALLAQERVPVHIFWAP